MKPSFSSQIIAQGPAANDASSRGVVQNVHVLDVLNRAPGACALARSRAARRTALASDCAGTERAMQQSGFSDATLWVLPENAHPSAGRGVRQGLSFLRPLRA